MKAMVIMYNNHDTVKVSSENVHSPLTPIASNRHKGEANKLEATTV